VTERVQARLGLGLALSCLAALGAASAHAAPPDGNAQGLALLARVRHAYVDVPAVGLSSRLGSQPTRLTVILHAGIVTAEQFVLGAGSMIMVGSSPSSAYLRRRGASCWSKLPASQAAQTFDSIGYPFPDTPHITVGKPRRIAGGWLLSTSGDGGPSTYTIDGKTFRIRFITFHTPGSAALRDDVSALARTPRLVAASPRC